MTAEEITKQLLKHASYYWYDDNNNSIDPINTDEFDPAVDKIFKSNAYEIQKLYKEIATSQNEVIKGLANVLVPDKYSMPEPGYTVAHINPKFSHISLDTDDMFVISGKDNDGDDHEFFFTPLFKHEYPSCDLQYLLCKNHLWEVKGGIPERLGNNTQDKSTGTRSIWLGLDIGKVEHGDQISFYLGNQILEQFDKDLAIFHLGRWYVNGNPKYELTVARGLEHVKSNSHRKTGKDRLTDSLHILDSYEKRIIHRFQDSFITISFSQNQDAQSGLVDELIEHKRKAPEGHEKVEGLKDPLLWIKIEFELEIPYEFFTQQAISPNSIPLVNRKSISRNVSKSSFDRMLLPMPTSNYFLGVNKIWDDTGSDESYETVDYLAPDTSPASYLVRRGERVRRLNNKDAREQIFTLLDLIYDEVGTFKEGGENRLTQEFQTIEKALNRIKLRLAKIEVNDWNQTDYFALANIRPRASIIYYNYWECQGAEVQNLAGKTKLEIRSNDKQIEDSYTLIPIQSGENEKSADDYLNYLKTAIISRNKIVTRGDIEMYCLTHYGHIISKIDIGHKIVSLIQEPSRKERVISINLSLHKVLGREDCEFLKGHIQNELNAKSAFFTPMHVHINQP